MARLRLSYPSFRLPPTSSGAGSLRTLADLPRISDWAFLVSAQPSIRSLLDEALSKVDGHGDRLVISKPPGEPTVDSIKYGGDRLRARRCAGIVAVGGGSVLDWARLSWAYSEGLLDLDRGIVVVDGKSPDRPTLILVPSTFASGAEAASVAVYLGGGRKHAVVSPLFVADRVILDGRFLASLDGVQLSASFADALSHSVESLLSIVPNNLAKLTAGSALRALLRHTDGGPPTSSRADCLLEASFLAGGAASHTSVGIAHALAHALAVEGVGHGQGNALGLVPAIRCNQPSVNIQRLLDETGITVEDLVTRIRAVVAPARRTAGLLAGPVLADNGRRDLLVQRMMEDVAIRSNPIRADADFVEAFLDFAAQEIALP